LAPTFSNDVSRKTFETNDLVSLFNRIPIEGESLTITRPNDLTRTNGITGGYLAYWKSEVEQFTGTRAQLRRIESLPRHRPPARPCRQRARRQHQPSDPAASRHERAGLRFHPRRKSPKARRPQHCLAFHRG
jgi:hypothetical protein